jgi:hypothetical protein
VKEQNVDAVHAELAAITVDIGLHRSSIGRIGFREDDHLLTRHVLQRFANVGVAAGLIGRIPEIDALIVVGAEEIGKSLVAELAGLV